MEFIINKSSDIWHDEDYKKEINSFDELKQFQIESGHSINEQNSTDKIEPKFKIGDTIIKKHNSDILYFGSFTITDITGGKYWYNDRIICDITEQDEWELFTKLK